MSSTTISIAVFPPVTYFCQGYFASIGHSVPAVLGAALAQRDQGNEGRVILIVGDGGLQLTVQEIGTMLKENLNIIIMVINNDGYTFERIIYKPEESKLLPTTLSSSDEHRDSNSHRTTQPTTTSPNGNTLSCSISSALLLAKRAATAS